MKNEDKKIVIQVTMSWMIAILTGMIILLAEKIDWLTSITIGIILYIASLILFIYLDRHSR